MRLELPKNISNHEDKMNMSEKNCMLCSEKLNNKDASALHYCLKCVSEKNMEKTLSFIKFN